MRAAGVPVRRPPPWLAPVERTSDEPDRAELGGPARPRRSVSSLAAALGADLRTPAVALVVSWSGLVALVWAGAVGAVLGVLVAAGALAGGRTAGLFHVHGAPGLRPWHLADGALSGAGGTVAAVGGRIFGSPLSVGAWTVAGLLVALLGLAVLGRFEEQILRLGGCRRPSSGELRRIAVAAQLAGAPLSRATAGAFLVVDSAVPLIRAHVEHVVLSTALLDRHDDDEVAALVCRALRQQDGGVRVRRCFVLACGWPVLGLDTLRARLHAAAGAGPVRVAAGLALWPVQLLAALVASVSERRAVHEEYDADAAARGAGLAAALAAVLRADPRPELTAGALDRMLGARAPAPLRIERLDARRRPLDAFLTEAGTEGTASAVRTTWIWLATVAAVVATVAGARLSDAAGTAPAAGAATAAASYAVSYLDAAFDPVRAHQVIESAVAPAQAPAAEREADGSTLGVASRLAAGWPSVSRARALGCRTLPAGGRAGAVVAVEVAWDYSVAGSAHHVVVTTAVPLEATSGNWRPSAPPRLIVASPRPSVPFGSCSR
jgi:hypothetical protein